MSKRRYNALSVLDYISEMAKDRAMGKIGPIHSLGYVLGDKPYFNPQGVVFKPFEDLQGRVTSMVRGRYTFHCPQPPQGSDSVPLLKSGYSVRLTACMKCPHHLPGMCCALLKASAGNPMEEVREMLDDAAEKAKSVVGS